MERIMKAQALYIVFSILSVSTQEGTGGALYGRSCLSVRRPAVKGVRWQKVKVGHEEGLVIDDEDEMKKLEKLKAECDSEQARNRSSWRQG
jgi:hypothetical protein